MNKKRLFWISLMGLLTLWNSFAVDSQHYVASDSSKDSISTEIADAISWMYDNKFTIYSNPTSFRSSDYITRQEASKFFVRFAEIEWLISKDNTKNCLFKDKDLFDSSLSDYIANSCKYNIFNWSNGKFMPTNKITKSQAFAVSLRSINKSQDETVSPWYKNYIDYAINSWWTQWFVVDNKFIDWNIKRWELALFIYRVHKSVTAQSKVSNPKIIDETYPDTQTKAS